MKTRVAVNGMGRIGRSFMRAMVTREELPFELVAANDLTDIPTLAHLLRYDSVLGPLHIPVVERPDAIEVGGHEVRVLAEREPARLPWKELGVDLVVESTGRFATATSAGAHITAGAGTVIVSAPVSDADLTVVVGVNEDAFDPQRHTIISNASCTTNCVTPMAKVLMDSFGLVHGLMTTVHAYTNDQVTLDFPHKDLRRARTAATNIIPTSTGAARTVSKVIPALEGRLDGVALRVPVPDGSITDLVAELARPATAEEINAAFLAASNGQLKGVLEYTDRPIVSSDIVGNPASCVFDSSLTMAGGHRVKIFGWYDNEWGYANRLVDLTAHVARR